MNLIKDSKSNLGKYYNHDAHWKKQAAVGSTHFGSMSGHMYEKVFQLTQKFFPETKTILDLGCGAGGVGRQFGALFDYIGVEESPVAVQLANEKLPDLDIRQGDITHLLEIDKTFDLIVSVNVIHCLVERNDRIGFWKNCGLLLKKGGGLILTTMCAPIEYEKSSPTPRVFLSYEQIVEEAALYGLWQVVTKEIELHSSHNPVSNLTLCKRLLV